MKVMILIGNSSIGGAQRVAMLLCGWINKRIDSSAMIVSLVPSNGQTYDMSGLPHVELKRGGNITGQLRSQIRQQRPDLVLSMGVPMAVYTVPACMGTGVRHIISERGDPGLFHGKTYIKNISRLLMRLGDGFVFQTEDARHFYSRLKREKTVVIPNPLSNAEKMPAGRFCGQRDKTIVTAGRMIDKKDHVLLIDAFCRIAEKYPEYQLIIWGEGTNKAMLTEYCEQKHITDRVQFPGVTEELFSKIYRAGMFVLSSISEGMPNALMEALALGIPCISTDCPCGAPKELIGEDRGLLVPVGDAVKLADAMKFLIENPDRADQFGTNALKIREQYNCDAICERWYSFFQKVLAK